jgi:hypothetical protein
MKASLKTNTEDCTVDMPMQTDAIVATPVQYHPISGYRVLWCFILLVWLAIQLLIHYYVFTKVFQGKNGVKIFCAGQMVTDTEHICIIAVGQFAQGIFTFGQITVGVFNISQIGIGSLFSVGQISPSLIFSIGQMSVGIYVYRAQFGIALWKVEKAQIGFNLITSYFDKKKLVTKCLINRN